MAPMVPALKPNLLCIVPPYLTKGAPPLGPGALLGYLRSHGCDGFDFLDLRLWVPNAYAPTYRPAGVFGETYVLDVPDLPLILKLLKNFRSSRELKPEVDKLFERYCLERGISPQFLYNYISAMDQFLRSFFSQIGRIDFVGFTVWSSNFLTTLIAAAHLKRRSNPPLIVLGGPQVTESRSSAKLALRAGLADFVALGEGEETLLQLFEAFRREKGIPSQAIPGTMRFNAATREFEHSERPLLRLKNLPLPAFDQMPLPSYWSKDHKLRTVTYELSRGCTDKCTFCSEWVFWRRMRLGDMYHVAEGVEEMSRRFNAERIWFMDSLLNAKLDPLREFAIELLRRGIKVQWGGFLRAQMDDETALLLKRAGCEFAFVGVESLSDETLELMNKRRTEADNLRALRALLRAGLRHVVAGFIPGFPGDTRERFLKTALALSEIRREYPEAFRVNVEPFVISPAQPIYADLAAYGLEPHRWPEPYLDLAPEFRNLTEDIFCHVTGRNQGLDRIGQFQIARTVTVSPRRQSSPDPYLYSEAETLSSENLDIVEIGKGVYLGRAKSPAGLAYGLILTKDEKEGYESQTEFLTLNLADSDGHPEAFFHRESHESFLEKIETLHLAYPNRNEPKVCPGFYTSDLDSADEICLSPFAAARLVEHDDGEGILVVDISTLRQALVPSDFAALLAKLSAEPLSLQQLESLEGSFSGNKQVFHVLHSLKELGLLKITSTTVRMPQRLPASPEAVGSSPLRTINETVATPRETT